MSLTVLIFRATVFTGRMIFTRKSDVHMILFPGRGGMVVKKIKSCTALSNNDDG